MEFTPNFLQPARDEIQFRMKILRNSIGTTDIENYNSSMDPYEQVTIDPDTITEWSRRPLPNHHNIIDLCGRVEGGDWDIRESFETQSDYERDYYLDIVYDDIKFTQTTFYQSMTNHFIHDTPWEETEYVQSLFDVLHQRGVVVWGGNRNSRKAILDRCEEIDELYNSMDQYGYRSQIQLGRGRKDQLTNEVLVDVGRDGSYLLVDGKHRLAIAQLLNLDSITATVLVRHEKWTNRLSNSTNT